MTRRPPRLLCKKDIYRFCRRRTNRTYVNNRANRRLGRAGHPVFRYVLTKIGDRRILEV